jgi:O-antigen/teichoic acid export membrane protein
VTGRRRSLTHQTVAGLLWTTCGKGAYGVLQLVVLAILARLLTPADFGVVSAALIVIALSGIVSQLGMGPALVQRPVLERRHIDTAFAASVFLDTLLGAVIWLGAPIVSGFFRIGNVEPVLRALAWVFPLQGLATVAESLMTRELRFRSLASLDVISYGVGYGVVGITLALLGRGVWALVAAQIAQNVIKTAILLSWQPPRLRSVPQWRAFQDLMYFGGGFTVAKIANQLAAQGDYLVVGRFLGPAALGYYGRAFNLMSAPASGFGTVLDAVLFPAMARVQTSAQRLAAAYRRGLALIALTFLPLSLCLFLLAPEVIHVMLGPHWTPVIAPFQVLVAGMLFRSSSKIADSLTRATGAVYRRAWRQILYAGLVIGGAWVGKHWGITAVAGGVLFAITVNFLLMAHLSLSEARMTWSDLLRAQVPALLIAAVSGTLVWGTATVLRNWALPPLVVLIAGGTVMVGSALVLMLMAPSMFLGADGQWIVDTMRGFVRSSTRSATTPAEASVAK